MYHHATPSLRTLALGALALSLAACADSTPSAPASAAPVTLDRVTSYTLPSGAAVQFGPSITLGNGNVRTYVAVDAHHNRPLEIGVAIDEHALEGLPTPADGGTPMSMPMSMPMGASMPVGSVVNNLALPANNPTPFKFVELDWNPLGHEPAGVYDVPHFDFHFYRIAQSARDAINPSDPRYDVAAANLPAAAYRAPFYVDGSTAAGGAPAGAVAVPFMGLHWMDTRSPELQNLLGNPAGYEPFTKTFLFGSWDGHFIFYEPMITRAYIMAKRTATSAAVRDELIPIPQPNHFGAAGYYPNAYRIAYDAHLKAYFIALTQLSYHDN